jgi:hypothetical protein
MNPPSAPWLDRRAVSTFPPLFDHDAAVGVWSAARSDCRTTASESGSLVEPQAVEYTKPPSSTCCVARYASPFASAAVIPAASSAISAIAVELLSPVP